MAALSRIPFLPAARKRCGTVATGEGLVAAWVRLG